MEHEEQKFIEGFNHGYIIAKHEPELYSKIEKGLDSKDEYVDGFVSGGKEYELEKHSPQKSHDKDDRSKDRDIDIERDR